jgi:hypothetical protein
MIWKDGHGFLHATILKLASREWGLSERDLTTVTGSLDEIIRVKKLRTESERKKAADWNDRVIRMKAFPPTPLAHYSDKTQKTAHKSDAQEQFTGVTMTWGGLAW